MFLLCLKMFALGFATTLGMLFAVGFVNALTQVRKESRARDEKNNME